MKTYKLKIGGNSYVVDINSVEGNVADVCVNGASYKVEIEGDNALAEVRQGQGAVAGVASPVTATQGSVAAAQAGGGASPATQSPAVSKPQSGAGKQVTSPLPGVIIEISVKEGQAVKEGEKVAVIEAMKMENEIQATSAGTISAIHVVKGDSVQEGAPIVTIA